tara:strand:+ start:367 stop:630 length:264 start_codon:yes stop_codon:yes gene_type:complete
MKEKIPCLSCKRKPVDVSTLQTTDLEKLTQAFDYLQRASEMNHEKWDLVEDVYMDLFPSKQKLNRSCRDCLRNVAKGIEHEYRRLVK